LSKNGRIKVVDMASCLGVGAKKASYRIRRLEADGIIASHTYEPDFESIGLTPHELDLDMRNLKDIQNAIYFFSKTQSCTFAHKLLGRYNLSLEFYAKAEEMMDILADFKKRFSGKYNDYDLSHITTEELIGWSPYGRKEF
jgi:DNA-binding Lrp family transcriptional regulator